MATYPVVLKRVSDGLTINGLLADGQSSRQSIPYSSDSPGRPGRIVINSFHKGSGKPSAEEGYYAGCQGWDATRPNHVRSVPQADTPVLLNASYAVAGDTNRAEFFQHPDAGEILVTPQHIYEAGVLVDSATAGNRFTGSYAIFGDRTFFGMEVTTADRASKALCRVRTGTAVGTYANTDFAASYFVAIGSRLFRVIQNASYPKISASWTDDTGTSTPSWFTSYTYPTEQFATDAASLQGTFVIATGGIINMPGKVITLDIGGSFTNILPAGAAFAPVARFLPFSGGLIALIAGPLSDSIYFEDVNTASPLDVQPIADTELIIPATGGFCATSTLDTAWIGGKPGPLNYSGFGVGEFDLSQFIVRLHQGNDGHVSGHYISLPSLGLLDTVNNILGGHVFTSTTGSRTLKLAYLFGSPRDDLKTVVMPVWNGNRIPAVLASGVAGTTGLFTTSEYLGDSYGLKQLLSVAFRSEVVGTPSPTTDATLTVRVYGVSITGVATLIGTATLTNAAATLGGAFQLELDDTDALVRSCYLTWTFTSTEYALCDVLCPIVIDYIEMPNQRQQASLSLLAGSLQINAGGGMTKQSRRTLFDNLDAAVKDPSPWTLQWWDDVVGTPSWTVLIESYKSSELEEPVRPGDGAAVINLVVRRLNTTTRVV